MQDEGNRESKLAKFNDDDDKFHHHHGTHYSTGSYIDYYLMRLEPFTSLLVELQNYTQENPARMLHNLKDTIKIASSGSDNRELIPELYSKIEFFVNVNCAYFGIKKNKKIVDDIEKVWKDDIYNYNSLSNYVQFIIEHKKLLNSKEIAVNINCWIDNVFGIGQLPKNDEESFNIFIKTSYETKTNLHKKLNRYLEKEGNFIKVQKKLANKINLIISFGQTPQQIFTEKHKGRTINYGENISGLAKDNPDNYGDDEFVGNDFLDTFIESEIRSDNKDILINKSGIFFEINNSLEKLFIICENNDLLILNTNFYSYYEENNYYFEDFSKSYEIPNIYFSDKYKIEDNDNYYLPNIKYCFSSFPYDTLVNTSKDNTKESKKNNIKEPKIKTIKEPIPYLYSNKYIKFLSTNNGKDDDKKTKPETFKFMTCRYLDNTFKIHFINQKKNIQKCSYFCEDFVI